MKTLRFGAIGVIVALALSACGSGAATEKAASGNALYDALPRSVQDAGTLKVGGSATVAPYLSKEGTAFVGLEKDLIDALGQTLGVKVELLDIGFAGLVPALQSRKIDVAMSDFTDTAERQQAVTFVDYTKSFSVVLAQAGNPKNLKTVDDLCGTTVASTVGTTSEKLADQQKAKCEEAGRPSVNVLRLENSPTTKLQVQSGRAAALMIDYVIGQHIAGQGQGAVIGEPFYLQYHGAAVRKDNEKLRDALVAAFTKMMADGTYTKILAKWKVDKLAMDKPLVNAATS
jgi:polar amino acid transport system substrate-binding protein